jgi:cytochrome c peroxidase
LLALSAAAGAPGPTDARLGLPPLATPAPAPALIDLGRALFFERRLSVNATLSCAMCHLPEEGYTANGLRTSVGMEGVSLRRNAPTLLNVAWVRPLFHDGRTPDLESQAWMPVLHPDEMANPDQATVLRRIARWPEYRPLLRRAFGSERPTRRRMAQALAAFQRTLVAGGSRFDQWRYGGRADALSAEEQRGFALFARLGCTACHPIGPQAALFTDQGFHNVGVQARSEALGKRTIDVTLVPGQTTTVSPEQIARVGLPEAPDLGRQEVSADPADARAFRTPSLRNVALTAPYMHDGSFDTLEAVIDHYAAGGWPADPRQDVRIRPFELLAGDRAALSAFLRSLTSPAATALACRRAAPQCPS